MRQELNIEKVSEQQKLEECFWCEGEFDVNKHDNSGYINDNPICAICRDEIGDYV